MPTAAFPRYAPLHSGAGHSRLSSTLFALNAAAIAEPFINLMRRIDADQARHQAELDEYHGSRKRMPLRGRMTAAIRSFLRLDA